MSKKKSILDMLETHLDKIVLGVIALIGLYLLWAFVVGNPYGVEVHGRKLGPGQIDQHNKQQAQMLQERLNEPAETIVYDLRLTPEFEDLLRSPLSQLATNLVIPVPGVGEQVFDDDRVYLVPEVAPLADVQIASLRGAVHKPTDEIGPDNTYQSVSTELGDLDLVTVSGRVDMQTLYRNFQQSFMGPRLNATWREPTFAQPIFARLELQRRRQSADGSWSDWTVVPRTQIDSFRKLIEQTPMTTEEMEFGGVMLWIKQYEDPRVQVSLLQPDAYDFASTQTPWLPPKYLDEAMTILKRQEDELRRQQREERLRARETVTNDPMMPGGRQPARDTRRQPTRQSTRQPRGGQRMMPDMMPETPVRTSAAARRERTLEDIQREMQQERIDEQTKLETRRDPLLVWAHDDTTQPGETYQYRIRLGVFNPIAGRNWFPEDQEHYKNQVVFWSAFSEPTKAVVIPKMLHIFPTDMLAGDVGGGVKIDVARYYLGQWRTREFEVFPGQVIGNEAEYEPPTADASRTTPGRGIAPEMMPAVPMPMGLGDATTSAPALLSTIDFTTPYLLVDINSQVEWTSNFSSRSEYSQMLYYDRQQVMLAMAIGKSNWPAEMRRQLDEIKTAERNAVPLDMTRTREMRTMPGRDRMMPEMMPDMMMDFDMMF